MNEQPFLLASGVSHRFATSVALDGVHIEVHPGEVVAIVGESGSGKSTLLRVLSGQMSPDRGDVQYIDHTGCRHDILQSRERQVRSLMRTEWGFVYQHAADGLRMNVSAGGNIGERLMANGHQHYGRIREQAMDWLRQVEIDPARIDDFPKTFSGGMQQRLQIARCLVTHPRLVFMDEPTTGLDVSVQAKLLDLIRRLVAKLRIAVVLVTHDIAAARLLANRILVMRNGQVVEHGLTDRVLDDPQHPYTQLLVSSVLAA
ncbi:phosphonate C-P lyase system protein PhnK [Pseudoroseomonas globiformis]|uniref:Phosphonate C-P lyase system protein PhnK n=1 Tax=Teichococcus globiformis TaxID=2307229 RepID=A0ABV7FZK5_9PROT